MFRARLPSISSTSHKMPRPPHNLHLVATWRSPDNAIRKTSTTTHLKCCACHAKWRWRSPKCCACQEKSNSSSWHDAKVLRLPHKKTVNTLWKMLDRHEVPGLPRETKLRGIGNHQSDHFCRTCHMHGHTGLTHRLRTVADGCERLQTVATVNATSSEHTLNPETPRVKREPLLRIRESEGSLPCPLHHIPSIMVAFFLLGIRTPWQVGTRIALPPCGCWRFSSFLNNCTEHNKQKCSENIFWTGQKCPCCALEAAGACPGLWSADVCCGGNTHKHLPCGSSL